MSTSEGLRRSARIKLKVTKSMNETENIKNLDTNLTQKGNNDSKSIKSKDTTSSSLRRLQLQAILEADRKKAKIDKKQAELDRIEREKQVELNRKQRQKEVETEKRLIDAELQLKQLEIEEGFESSAGSLKSHSSANISIKGRIENWVETTVSNKDKNLMMDENMENYSKDSIKETSVQVKERNTAVNISEKEIQPSFRERREHQLVTMKKPKSEEMIEKYLSRQFVNKDLPSFSGEPSEWLQFISEFRETTKICGFTERENMVRLKKCLKGKAKETVQALLNFTFEVEKVIEILEKRFGKSELIIRDLINKVRRFPDIKEESYDSIIDFSIAIQNLTVTLKSLNKQAYLLNPQLIEEIMVKLTPNLRLNWGTHVLSLNKVDVTIIDILDWIAKISDAVNVVQMPEIAEKKKKYVGVATIQEIKHNSLYCAYCKNKTHDIMHCKLFTELLTDKRWEWVKQSGMCFSCFGNHSIKICRRRKKCGFEGCIKYHHPLLHNVNLEFQNNKTEPMEIVSFHSMQNKREVLLRVAPVTIFGPKAEIHTFALFDEGSTITLINKELSEKLGILGPIEPLSMRWTNCITNVEEDSQRITLKIKGKNMDESYVMKNVRTIKNLDLPTQSVDYKSLAKKWSHLSEINISSLMNAKPQILIGQDNIGLIIAREVIEASKNAPIVSRSKLGWVVHGNLTNFKGRVDEEFVLQINHKDTHLNEIIKQNFKLESLGVKLENNLVSKEEKRAIEIMEKTSKRNEENKWEIGLLWKEDVVEFPSSMYAAINRLKGIERKMKINLDFEEAYHKKIKEYVDKNYAVKLSEEDAAKENLKTWYLPHFGVINPKKPKLRFVFDAAFKINNTSLNSMLLKGPDLLNSLLGILFRFRQRPIAFTADIKEMFHQVTIIPEDRCAQRFLWRGSCGKIETYEMKAMIFGATSSPASATYIMRKNAEEFKEIFPEAYKAVCEQHYVDDYLGSVDNLLEAKKLVSSVIEVHRKGGFEIRNWTSNSKELLKHIPTNLRSGEVKDMDLESELPNERILGLFWNTNMDKFLFKLKFEDIEDIILERKKSTKRTVLSIVMSIFDPLGFLLNFTVKGKILFQDIWRAGLEWDDALTTNLNKRWIEWITELKRVTTFSIPRCYVLKYNQSTELHIFCDASSKAFAAVGYLRIEEINEENFFVHTSFVMAKSRVSPLRPISIPRLELQAALLGSRLAKTIRENHSIVFHKIYYWSDSKTVISWIRSDARKFKPFVAHRLGEIDEITDILFWNWIPTSENIADEATRDNLDCDWTENSSWMKGPKFLKEKKETWNLDKNKSLYKVEDSSELKVESEFIAVITRENNLSEILPNIERFSSWLKLIRSTAWILRIVEIKHAICEKKRKKLPIELYPEEIFKAEMIWIKNVQSKDFEEEIKCLKRNFPINKSSQIYNLTPFLDNDGILRVRGRTEKSKDQEENAKYPIIMHPKNYFTELLIHHYHLNAGHNGQNFVANELRQKYWILNLRAAVRRTWNNCQVCKNVRAKPCEPQMAPIPSQRLESFIRPFTNTGMDFFGPMEITVGRRREKRYGVLFTCLSTRAVHLEVTNFINTDSTILAIRRFIGRRACPKRIYSDNGSNLRGSEKEIRKSLEELDQKQIISSLTTRGIEWHFIPPLAPHMGGSWERLIKSVKIALKSVLKEQAPKEEVLQTLFVEAENIVNSRPLVHVSLDYADDEALTPNHFLIGTSSNSLPWGKFTETDLFNRKQWRKAQYFSDLFWKRWVHEYLPTLTRRTKWFYHDNNTAKVGDVVIIVDKDLPRNTWPKGIITKVYPGADGKVRAVDVKTSTGVYRRPVVKLCILTLN